MEKQRDSAQERFKQSHVTFCFAHHDTLKLLNVSLDMLAMYCPDVPRAQARRLQWLVNKVYNDLNDVLQTGREAFLSYLLSVGPESLDKLFALVADKTQQQVFQETENSIAKQAVSIAVQEHKANTVMSPLAKGAVAAAQKHPDDALLQAAARVVQTQAAPVKNGQACRCCRRRQENGRQISAQGKAMARAPISAGIYGRGTLPAVRTEASAQADLRHLGLLAGGAAQPSRAAA